MSESAKNITIAVLYDEADKDYWDGLELHLNNLSKSFDNVNIWSIKDIKLGQDKNLEIKKILNKADITLMLLSINFVNNNIIDEEIRILLRSYAAQKSKGRHRHIVPVIVQNFTWQSNFDNDYDLENLKVFNHVEESEKKNKNYTEIIETLTEYVEGINARSIRFVIPTWVGFLGGITYNGGFIKSKHTSLYKKFKRHLHFELSDTLPETCDYIKSDEADLIWATLDRLPSVLLKLKGKKPKIIAQVCSSNGADAIIARKGIKSIADLKGKKIICLKDSPSSTFLKYVLKKAGIDSSLVDIQLKKDVPLDFILTTFIADPAIDAIVTWSPFVEACLAEVEGAHVIADTKEWSERIVDVVVATEDYIRLNEEELSLLFYEWFEQVNTFNRDELYEMGALGGLVKAIIKPIPSIMPGKIREELERSLVTYFESSLQKVHLANLEDNLSFFELANPLNSPAANLYKEFLELEFPQDKDDPDLQWENVVNISILQKIKTDQNKAS